jgi:hypothetical protein
MASPSKRARYTLFVGFYDCFDPSSAEDGGVEEEWTFHEVVGVARDRELVCRALYARLKKDHFEDEEDVEGETWSEKLQGLNELAGDLEIDYGYGYARTEILERPAPPGINDRVFSLLEVEVHDDYQNGPDGCGEVYGIYATEEEAYQAAVERALEWYEERYEDSKPAPELGSGNTWKEKLEKFFDVLENDDEFVEDNRHYNLTVKQHMLLA